MNPRFVSPFLMWGIVIIGVIAALSFLPNVKLFESGIVGFGICAITALIWLYVFPSALLANREAAKSAAGVHSLIKTGVYSFVRHPIYSSDITFAFGIFAYTGTLRMLVSVLWLTLVMFLWVRLEEVALIEKFGGEYREYQKDVPMLFPKILKNR